MANYERGIYEPGDEVRVFDGSEEEEDVEGSRLPLLIVLALLVLAMFGGVVYLAYTQGVARGRGETPVLTAAAGPEKVAPQSPGGAKVPYQGFKIYEQPAPSDDSADAAAPAGAAPQAGQNRAAPAMNQSKPPLAKPAENAAMLAAPKPMEKLATAPATKPAEKPAPVAAPAMTNSTAPAAKAPAPAAKNEAPAAKKEATAAKTETLAANSTMATGAPHQLAVPAPAPAATSPPASSPAAASSAGVQAGSYVLQIGAYKSQADADSAWKTYKTKHAALLLGYSDNVQQADLGAKGTWYRLRVSGFSDKDVAAALCDRLKTDGGACFVGK